MKTRRSPSQPSYALLASLFHRFILLASLFLVVTSVEAWTLADQQMPTSWAGHSYTPSPGDWRYFGVYQVMTDRFYDGNPSNNTAHNYSTDFGAPSGQLPTEGNRRTIGGDFQGMKENIDYIKSLGYDAIWISNPFMGTEANGYAPTTYNCIDPKLGTVQEFRDLVDAAHARGMYVIVDMVGNHFANWFTDHAFNGAGYGTPTYATDASKRYGATFNDAIGEGNFHNYGNISNWNAPWDLEHGELVGLDDLITEDAYVRNYVIDHYVNMIKAFDIDGFRVDAIKHVNINDWALICSGIRAGAAAVGKSNFYMFGEAFSGSHDAVGYYTGNKAGTGTKIMNGMMDYAMYQQGVPWMLFNDQWGLKNWVAGMNNASYDMGQGNGTTVWNFGNMNVHFADNHDVARFLSSGDWDRMLSVQGMLTMIEGLGAMYYGGEQAFNTAGTDGRGAYGALYDHPFQWDNAVGDNVNMSFWLYKKIAKMMAARRRIGAGLGTGTTLLDPQNGIFAFRRGNDAFVAINGTNMTQSATFNVGLSGTWTNLVDGSSGSGPSLAISLPKYEVGVWIRNIADPVLEPMVTDVSPANGALTGATTLTITFDQNMDPASTIAAASIAPDPGGTWNVTGATLTRTGMTVQPGVTYVVKVAKTATNATGKAMYGGFVSRFKGSYSSPVVNGNVITFNYQGGATAKVKGNWAITGGSNGVYTAAYNAAWTGPAVDMIQSNGLWTATITLTENTVFEYGFEINGAWTNDPVNTNHAVNGNDRFTSGAGTPAGPDSVPPVFGGLTSATDAGTSGKVNLAWSAATDTSTPIKYNIFWTNNAADSVAKSYVDMTPNAVVSSATSYQVTGLTNGAQYWFVVRAEDAKTGAGGPGGGNQETNLVDRTATPTGLASPIVNGNVVTFAFSGGGLGKVKGSWIVTGGSNGNYTANYDSTWNAGATTNMVLSGSVWRCTFTLPANTTFEYGFEIDSAWTNDPLNTNHAANGNDKFTTGAASNGDTTPPSFAGLATAVDSGTGGRVSLAWAAGTDATGPVRYNVYWTNSAAAQVSKSYVDGTPDATTTSTSYLASGLTNASQYWFVVRAEDSAFGSGPNGGNQDTNLVDQTATPSGASNTAPTANAQNTTTPQNTAKVITLTGSDPEGSSLTFAIATQPSNGTLSAITAINATSASVTYTPNTNFNGNDAFTFTVNDGLLTSASANVGVNVVSGARPPIYISFLWHMHQPKYWPDEPATATEGRTDYGFSIRTIHTDRTGPYTSWPIDAIQNAMNAGLANSGAQVTFTGSLTENLNDYEAAGWAFGGWKNRWREGMQWRTALNNPRLDITQFPYFHVLQPLIGDKWTREHIRLFQNMYQGTFSAAAQSKGMFPTENCVSDFLIPAWKDNGIDWVIVDNVHFDRTALGYPWSSGGNLYEMNGADILNPNPNDWVQLNGLWAPTKISARWGHQPHYMQYVDPTTGTVRKMIAVPGSRYLGNEDARGGYGALQYDAVLSQLEPFNTDPAHPILVVLPHDGDNYGGGTDGYYHGNFSAMISWLQSNPTRFQLITIQDYLSMFPPDQSDVMHIEPGGWSGADNGDPEYKKWNGDPAADGYSPDRNSWMTLMAAENRVEHAERLQPTNGNVATAIRKMMVGMTSCYWYWDGSPPWDYHVTRACNEAVGLVDPIIAGGGADLQPPTVFLPQRDPYNPGGKEWNIQQASNLKVFTPAYDVSGLRRVELKYRVDDDGNNPIADVANEVYAGGAGVGAWQTLSMTVDAFPASRSNPQPIYRANIYAATIDGTNLANKLVDYYVEAEDNAGLITKTVIQHVKWGGTGGGGGGTTIWSPSAPTSSDTI
ncbi:MAG: alpha-amylase family glycosyl hydrolase, partial [Candidatus Hydrogenedentota bacterium]